MAKEIERKFIVISDSWKSDIQTIHNIKQGYLYASSKGNARIRIKDDKAYITIKSSNTGIARDEFEYEIPVNDAIKLMDMTEHVISKARYDVIYDNKKWEVDVFDFGLVMAEVELESESEVIKIPEWVGNEVTTDPKYRNINLAIRGL